MGFSAERYFARVHAAGRENALKVRKRDAGHIAPYAS